MRRVIHAGERLGRLPDVKRATHYVFVKQRHNWKLLTRFGIVGASGVIVNQVALTLAQLAGPASEDVWIDLPATSFNVRWYHLFVTFAFFIANLWNFQLNRGWTFGSSKHAPWLREYVPFLLVGLISLVLNLAIVTALMHPSSPVELPASTFGGFDARLRWSNLIAVAVITPLSFVFNKLWTFSSVRHHAGGRGA
jgi:putative flippase GtrA